MKSRNVVLLALAIGCGLVAAFLTAKLGASGKTDTVPVLVAVKNIDQGTRLEKPEELFTRKQFTKDAVPPEFIDDVNQLRGKTLQRTLRPGSHVTIDDITQHNEVDLPVDEKTGEPYRAMGIKVTQESSVNGLIKPGSRVDVVCVERLPNGRSASTVILQYVLVVSVNDQMRPSEMQGPIKNVANVALAVKQQEGAILALASKRGELTLQLRSKDDKKIVSKVRTIDSLTGEVLNDAGQPLSQPEMFTIPVAIKPIPAGTTIDDPAKWFEEKKFVEIPPNAVAKLDDLKGKTVKKEIFQHAWVAVEAFDGELAKRTEPAVLTRVHTVGLQVGGNAPQYYRFENGMLQTGESKTGTKEKELTPESKQAIKPEAKPETKPETPTDTKKDEGSK